MSRSTLRRHSAFFIAVAVAVIGLGCNESLAQKDVQPPPVREQRKATKEATVDFEKAEVGKTPQGFTAALTGGGGEVSWVVANDPSSPAGAKVLAQTSRDKTNKRYPVCVYDGLTAKDVDVSVQFRAISGEVDQAAGIVWRYRDKDNYYVVRANALENNVVLYKTENGVRTDLKLKGKDSGYGVKAEVVKDKWNTLKVSAVGNSFVVSLNNKPLFEVVDDTFPQAGKAGLWTKADSVTHFDNLKIESHDQR
jgi:Domain of Unknown Function (DUF1080)